MLLGLVQGGKGRKEGRKQASKQARRQASKQGRKEGGGREAWRTHYAQMKVGAPECSTIHAK